MFQMVTNVEDLNQHDALVLGIFEGEPFHEEVEKIDKLLAQQVMKLKRAKKIAKQGQTTVLYTLGNSQVEALYVIGLGKKVESTTESVRETLASVSRQLKEDKISKVAYLVESLASEQVKKHDIAVLIGEALALGTYTVLNYKEKNNEVEVSIEQVALLGEEDLVGAARVGYIYGQGTNRARKLVNTPGNLMTPTDLAEEANELANEHGFEIEVLEREDMEKLGMGALLAVAAGSDQPPKMIVLKYVGDPKSEELVGFVGKGLTFDSGGISIKPRENMHEMKMDMGGAATVLGAMDIIGSIKPKVNVLAVIPSSENLLNGSALKPGDVITSLSGKTIEVRNTDAEGRLILADGITYAKQLGATSLIDVATLTGAVMIALGDCTTGAVTNNNDWMEEVVEASIETDEWIWTFPTYAPYKKMLKSSDVADLNNAPGRLAGSITAGLFIGEFAEETPWVHLDIAGTAWQSKASNLGPLGGTGAMTRTLAQVVINKEK
ncbi:cytosol aminopeptidase PepA [Halalkalibacter wakoensis JCM 9140]|uniref:Probable cytosol aminopeptidase n=1 Tax=Halalkalibacter wakoensis JCM 9140 TaxID=1236970 RepID=W4Q978_9BACI|nr:leucyl aminopeptidase [Halalkalibacter wakoensis]GAE27929.1 cytosol aminopeptidase PepA [Halalkalibacter wakoensis JCM 9140]